MNKAYVIQVNGAYRIADSRVSLDSIVYAWMDGQSPETIADNFPVLTLEEVYGAIAFYLSNREAIDEYLREKKAEFEEMRRKSVEELRKNRPQLYAKLMAAKQRRAATETEPEFGATMKIKFQADADFNYTILKALRRRQPAIDFQPADDAKLRGLPDPDVLALAAKEGRILVSHDCNTMPDHFADFTVSQHSPGVFILAQDIPISLAVEELLTIWEASEAEEWVDVLQWLPL